MISRTHCFVLAGLILAAVAVSGVFTPLLPERVPVHYNLSGEADRYGSRWELLIVFPALIAVVAVVMVALPLLGPFRRNFERFQTTYGRVCIAMLSALVAMQVVAFLKAQGVALQLGATLAIVFGLTLAVIGNWLGKVRRNFYLGIRTPWTLANDLVWERTHRFGARLFTAHGLVAAACGFFAPDPVCFVVLIGGLVAVALICTLYSIYCYHKHRKVDELAA